jgi:hypothetical protein
MHGFIPLIHLYECMFLNYEHAKLKTHIDINKQTLKSLYRNYYLQVRYFVQ